MNATAKEKTVTRGRPKTAQAKRPTRIPMSGQRMRMHLEEEDKDPNFHYGWINDTGGLIHRAKQAGYVNVLTSEMPTWGSKDVDSADSDTSVVSMPVGNDTIAYLMKQPMEFYEEDQAEEQRIVDSRESDMKKNLNSGQGGTYGNVDIA